VNEAIVRAIRDKRRVRFTYNGKTRLAEPQCYGVGSKGTELLRVHQLQGGSQREPLFDVSKMADLVVLDEASANWRRATSTAGSSTTSYCRARC
jgi:hypothetical protein